MLCELDYIHTLYASYHIVYPCFVSDSFICAQRQRRLRPENNPVHTFGERIVDISATLVVVRANAPPSFICDDKTPFLAQTVQGARQRYVLWRVCHNFDGLQQSVWQYMVE